MIRTWAAKNIAGRVNDRYVGVALGNAVVLTASVRKIQTHGWKFCNPYTFDLYAEVKGKHVRMELS